MKKKRAGLGHCENKLEVQLLVTASNVAMNTCIFTQAEAIPETIIRTLVVDDSPFMLKVLAQTVESAGNFELIGSASDGCQAVRYVSQLSPELVLIDIHMPRMNGVQALRCIKQRENAPAVIVVTSDDSSATKRMAEEAGADGFVIKDWNLRPRLLHALRDVFGPSAARREAPVATQSNTGT